MKAKFVCDYLYNSGKFCDRASTRSEGCQSYYKAKKGQFCSISECSNITKIPCDLCHLYIGGYYQIQYVNKLRYKAQIYDQYTSEVRLRGET